MNKTAEFFEGFEVVSTYTRQQAIEDGYLVPVSELFPSDTRTFKIPVCFSRAVWDHLQAAAEKDQQRNNYKEADYGVYVWDICNMAALQSKTQKIEGDRVYFTVSMPLGCRDFKMYALIHGDDTGRPCCTIMMEGED